MAGFFTPGLTLAAEIDLQDSKAPLDTNKGQGQSPQSVSAAPWQVDFKGEAQALSGAANMTIDADDGIFFTATLTGNRTLGISNLQPGAELRGLITQDGTGSRTITVTAGSGGATLTSGTPLTTTAAAVDLIGIMNIGTFDAPQYAYYPIAKNLA